MPILENPPSPGPIGPGSTEPYPPASDRLRALFTESPRRLILGNAKHTRRAGAVRPRPFPFRVLRCYRTNLRASRATATTIAASIINFLKLTYLLLPKSVFVPD